MQEQTAVFLQMHAVDCMRRLLSAIQTSLCTVSVSAAGAPWHKPSAPVLGSSFPMSCRNSQSLCREPRLPATLEANTLLPTPVQEQPGLWPQGRHGHTSPRPVLRSPLPACCRDSQGFCCECTLAQATSASFTSGSSADMRAGLDCSLWSSDLFLNGVPGSASCMRYADLWYEVGCCCTFRLLMSWYW